MDPTLEHVAVRACLAAGRDLRERFENGTVAADRDEFDVTDAADRAAEDHILEIITGAFPDHALYTEESGTLSGESRYRWVVDPLDGTNNFVSGMPSFGTSVAVLDGEDEPILGVVYVPVTDDLYLAKRGAGVTYNGTEVQAATDVPLSHATIGYVIGREVKRDGRKETAGELYDAIDGATKRVVASWSPVVHWGLLSRGRLEGMVTYHADKEEQHAGEILAREAGASVFEDGPLFVAATDEEAGVELFEAVQAVIS